MEIKVTSESNFREYLAMMNVIKFQEKNPNKGALIRILLAAAAAVLLTGVCK